MYWQKIDKKFDNMPETKVVPAICCWSDLLGFGNIFKERNWELIESDYTSVANRLVDTQKICARNVEIGNEYILVLNDGFIRNFDLSRTPQHFQFISFWFRSIIWFHMQVNSHENKKGLPGVRTVVSAGERLLHNWERYTTEDYVFNYTKPDPNGTSTNTKLYGEKDIIFNPTPLQMNSAFSKAYIIDSGGSKKGVAGNNFFIEQSAIDIIVKYAKHFEEYCAEPQWLENDDNIEFIVPKKTSALYHFGLILDKNIINFDSAGLSTKVYKVLGMYVWDEDPKEFHIDISEEMLPNLNVAKYDDKEFNNGKRQTTPT